MSKLGVWVDGVIVDGFSFICMNRLCKKVGFPVDVIEH